MTLSMHQASVPVFLRQFKALSIILTKAEAFAEAKKIDPSVLLTDRLSPDMHTLTRQIQIASDAVKGGMARLAGIDPPSFPDTETSFPELVERIAKTVAFLESLRPEQIDGAEDRTITLKIGGSDVQFAGQAFLLHIVIPNFFFHVTMAYAILRHDGVEIGKRDYLGGL